MVFQWASCLLLCLCLLLHNPGIILFIYQQLFWLLVLFVQPGLSFRIIRGREIYMGLFVGGLIPGPGYMGRRYCSPKTINYFKKYKNY